MNHQDKVAVITGGARGIGKAIAAHLGKEGAKVVILDLGQEAVNETVNLLRSQGCDAYGIQANVVDSEAITAAVKSVCDDHGKIDIWVNNAGITRDNLLMRMKEEEWDAVLAVNLKGTFNCIKAVSRPMMKARQGAIINISSVVGVMGNAGQANYSASKAGVIGLTKSAAKELAARNITVNAVAPGFIQTDMTAELSDDAKAIFLQNIPLKRGGTPEDVAGVVSFLGSAAASYVTGQVILVDGGMRM